MKTILALLLLPFLAFGQCDANKRAVVLTLQPGIEQTVEWSFVDCAFGLQNFAVYVTQPRQCPSCVAKALKPSTPLSCQLVNVTTGQVESNCPGWTCWAFQVQGDGRSVSGTVQRLRLLLGPSAHKPLDVLVEFSATFGGPP